MAESGDQRVVANSNQASAGRLHNGQLTIRLEAAMGEWSPEENDGPALNVAAFREDGGQLSTPGPLLRVLEGTEIHATVHNYLDQALTVHGLHARPGDPKAVLIVPAGESREVQLDSSPSARLELHLPSCGIEKPSGCAQTGPQCAVPSSRWRSCSVGCVASACIPINAVADYVQMMSKHGPNHLEQIERLKKEAMGK